MLPKRKKTGSCRHAVLDKFKSDDFVRNFFLKNYWKFFAISTSVEVARHIQTNTGTSLIQWLFLFVSEKGHQLNGWFTIETKKKNCGCFFGFVFLLMGKCFIFISNIYIYNCMTTGLICFRLDCIFCIFSLNKQKTPMITGHPMLRKKN